MLYDFETRYLALREEHRLKLVANFRRKNSRVDYDSNLGFQLYVLAVFPTELSRLTAGLSKNVSSFLIPALVPSIVWG